MKFLSLFTGVGGLDLGLEQAGLRCVAQVEIDSYCRDRLAERWPDLPRFSDVRTICRRIWQNRPEDEDGFVECAIHEGEDFGDCACVGTDQFIDEYGVPDLIVGGDPCQRNSNAWRQGEGNDSPAAEFIRIVAELRPRLVLRENPSIIRSDAPWPWWRFRGELERLGYVVLPFRLRACCVGADHRRDRLFLLAAIPDADRPGLERAIGAGVEGEGEWRPDPDIARPDRWSAAPRVCRGADGVSDRMDRLRALGNAVCPRVGRVIGKALLRADNAVV